MSYTTLKIAGKVYPCQEINGKVRTDSDAVDKLIQSLDKWELRDLQQLGKAIAEGKLIKDPQAFLNELHQARNN
ncbi:MAG: hypothetical protein ACO1NS_02040 [Daejeonella sp.]